MDVSWSAMLADVDLFYETMSSVTLALIAPPPPSTAAAPAPLRNFAAVRQFAPLPDHQYVAR